VLCPPNCRKNKEFRRLVKEGKLSLVAFCDWVGEGKFRRGEDIRKLSLVLKDEQSREALIGDNFQAALDQLEQKNPAVKSKLFEKIEDVIDGLESLPFGELDLLFCSRPKPTVIMQESGIA
jgi:hypothetical protein